MKPKIHMSSETSTRVVIVHKNCMHNVHLLGNVKMHYAYLGTLY